MTVALILEKGFSLFTTTVKVKEVIPMETLMGMATVLDEETRGTLPKRLKTKENLKAKNLEPQNRRQSTKKSKRGLQNEKEIEAKKLAARAAACCRRLAR